MPWFVNRQFGNVLLTPGWSQEEYSAENMPSTYACNMMTLQGTAAVRELKNNTKNRKIMQVEEQLYGIHIYIYIFMFI